MFDFFEGVIEKLGVRLISDFSNKLYDFISEIKKSKTDNDNGKDSAKIGSSGDSAQIGSSGNYAQIGSSGYSTKIGSSGYSAQIGSSGEYAQIGSSGSSAQIGSSGSSAQIGSSGYSAKIGSSGNYAQIGSSGYSTKIGSSGNSAKIGSSGNYAQIGSSGNSAKIGSSGDYAQIGSSGYSANIVSSGYSAKIGSSGYSAKIDVTGDYSVVADCGYISKVKAKNGTWITLTEFEQCKIDNKRFLKPIYMRCAQIGNSEYTDAHGNVLSEEKYYTLQDKKFYEVIIADGIDSLVISKKTKDSFTIYKIKLNDNTKFCFNLDKPAYLVEENGIYAHGETIKQAISDLMYKKLQNADVQEIVTEIKKTNKVTKAQYRAITGACQLGTNAFCEQHNIKGDSITLEKLRKILINDYGANKFWELIDKE